MQVYVFYLSFEQEVPQGFYSLLLLMYIDKL